MSTDLVGTDDSVSSGTTSCSLREPSIGTALSHKTDGIDFSVLVKALINFSLDGEIPRMSTRNNYVENSTTI